MRTQRVLHTYVPGLNQTVRIIVKASGLSADKNPNAEFGLFEYMDSFNNEGTYLHEYLTEFTPVWREAGSSARSSRLVSRVTPQR